MLLFFLLAADVLINYRLRWLPPVAASAVADAMHDPAIALVAIVVATLRAATPLLLAGFGELVTERSGVLNLGVEGMMLVGAAAGFIGTAPPATRWSGCSLAMLAGAALALVFGVLTLYADGQPGRHRAGADHLRRRLSRADRRSRTRHADAPGMAHAHLAAAERGAAAVQQLMLLDPLVWLALLVPFLVQRFLYRTRAGPGAARGRRERTTWRTRSATRCCGSAISRCCSAAR